MEPFPVLRDSGQLVSVREKSKRRGEKKAKKKAGIKSRRTGKTNMANEQDFTEALFFRSQETGGPMDLLPADWPEFYAGFFRPIRSQYSQSCLKPSPIKLNQRFLFVADIVSPHCRFIQQSDSRLKGILCPLPKTKIEVPDK